MITSWSFSRWTTYQQCPLKAKLLYIDKMQEPKNDALLKGTAVHEEIERYLVGTSDEFPKVAEAMAPRYLKLRELRPAVEMELAFTDKWERTDWFSKGAWCRIKMDAVVTPKADDEPPTVVVVDHKTGKQKGQHSEYAPQMELYGLGGLLAFPSAEVAVAELWFVEHNVVVPHHEDFTRNMVESLKETWGDRTAKMLSDTRFDPTPSDKCRWCHFRRANGGPCDY